VVAWEVPASSPGTKQHSRRPPGYDSGSARAGSGWSWLLQSPRACIPMKGPCTHEGQGVVYIYLTRKGQVPGKHIFSANSTEGPKTADACMPSLSEGFKQAGGDAYRLPCPGWVVLCTQAQMPAWRGRDGWHALGERARAVPRCRDAPPMRWAVLVCVHSFCMCAASSLWECCVHRKTRDGALVCATPARRGARSSCCRRAEPWGARAAVIKPIGRSILEQTSLCQPTRLQCTRRDLNSTSLSPAVVWLALCVAHAARA
jgi:hypothetical protein